jgi:hypothetical protein
MKISTNLKTIAEFVGIIAIVASLVFVGLQVRQEQDLAFAQITQAAIENRIVLNIAISDHADVWAKSNNGESLNDEELQILMRLVASDYRRAISTAFQRRRFGGDDANSIDLFAIQLYKNPGAARIWREMTKSESLYLSQLSDDTFMQRISNEIEGKLARLEQLNGQ